MNHSKLLTFDAFKKKSTFNINKEDTSEKPKLPRKTDIGKKMSGPKADSKTNESAFLVEDDYTVKSTFFVPKSLLTEYIDKVKRETGKNALDYFSESELSEQIINYIVKKNLNIDSIPVSLSVGEESNPDETFADSENDADKVEDELGDESNLSDDTDSDVMDVEVTDDTKENDNDKPVISNDVDTTSDETVELGEDREETGGGITKEEEENIIKQFQQYGLIEEEEILGQTMDDVDEEDILDYEPSADFSDDIRTITNDEWKMMNKEERTHYILENTDINDEDTAFELSHLANLDDLPIDVLNQLLGFDDEEYNLDDADLEMDDVFNSEYYMENQKSILRSLNLNESIISDFERLLKSKDIDSAEAFINKYLEIEE